MVDAMEDVYIVDAARSATGKFLGSLSELSSPRIGAAVVKGLMARSSIKPEMVEELITGNVLSAGLGQNPAKQVVVYSGLPNETVTSNVNQVCASGLRAIAIGADSIKCGDSGIVIAGGIESMSNARHTVAGIRKFKKLGDATLDELVRYLAGSGADLSSVKLVDELVFNGLWDCYSNLHMGTLAERIGKKYTITREEQDAFAIDSHRKAAAAIDAGKFKKEIIPINVGAAGEFATDEGVRRDTSIEKLASLKPAFAPDGTVTAGNASQISDGAAFVVLASASKVKELDLKPIAKIESYASSGIDPAWYGLAPVSGIQKTLKKAGKTLDDVDLIEINEAFCVQALGVVRALNIDVAKLNVNGGATALGHPIGASGARILTTLIYALHDRRKNLGIASLCHGGGGAASMLISSVV